MVTLKAATMGMFIVTAAFAVGAELARNKNAFHVANEALSGLLVLGSLAVIATSCRERSNHRDAIVSSVMLSLLTVAQLMVLFVGDPQKHGVLYSLHLLFAIPMIAITLALWEVARQPNSPSHAIVHTDFIWIGRGILAISAALAVACVLLVGTEGETQDSIAKYTTVIGAVLLSLIFVSRRQLTSAQATSTLVHGTDVLFGFVVVVVALSAAFAQWSMPWGIDLVLIITMLAAWVAAILFYLRMYERYGEIGIDAYDGDVPM